MTEPIHPDRLSEPRPRLNPGGRFTPGCADATRVDVPDARKWRPCQDLADG